MGKQKNLSRFAAVILAVCMTFGMIVVPAAAFAEGETAAAGQPSIETEQTYEVVVQADDDHPLDNPVELPSISSTDSGLLVTAGDDKTAEVTVDGSVTAEDLGIYVISDGEGSKVDLDVTGPVTSEDDAVTVEVLNGGSATVVTGMATSSEGSAIRISNDKGNLFVAVTGNAVSEATDPAYVERAGLTYYGEGDTKVLVVGTLSGYDGVQIMDDASTEGLDLTVWKIDKAADGEYITGDDAKESFAKSVSYIVMLEQPSAGATVSATKDDGSPLDKKYGDSEQTGFEVANQDQKVLLSVNLEKGYRLTGAYNGMEDRMALQKDEAGNYYLMVPMGGGVYFTVELSLVPEPSPKPEPVPQPAEGSTVVADYTSYSRVVDEEAISVTVLTEDGQPVQASIWTRFYGDGRFYILIDGGAFRVRGSYGTINGALTLTLSDGTRIPINSDGTFVIVLENGMRLVLHLEDTVIQEFIKP